MQELLSENRWKLDLFASIFFGVFIAYFNQVSRDSGEKNIENIFWSVFTAIISYLLAYIISIFFSYKIRKIKSWAWMGVVGSIIYAFDDLVILRFIRHWKSKESKSVFEYFLWLLPNTIKGFLAFAIIFTLFTMVTIFSFRLLAKLLGNIENKLS